MTTKQIFPPVKVLWVNVHQPRTESQCAAFCQVAHPDCHFYLYETLCYTGILSHTSGSFSGTAGTKTLTFDNVRTTEFLASHYSMSKSFTGRVWGAASYEDKSITNIKDCQLYCFLDNVKPCHAYYATDTG